MTEIKHKILAGHAISSAHIKDRQEQIIPLFEFHDASVTDIMQMKKPIHPKICGVYFLISHDLIVYVGQSKDVFHRLDWHKYRKVFDSYSIIECLPRQLEMLELHFIVKFDPRDNLKMPSNPWYKKMHTLKKELGILTRDWNLLIKRYNLKPVLSAAGVYLAEDVKSAWETELALRHEQLEMAI